MDIEQIVNDHEGKIGSLCSEVDNLKDKIEDLTSLKDAVIRLVVLEEKQDARNDKFDVIFEEQVKNNVKVSMTLDRIDTNLDKLNKRIEKVETKIETSEEKSKIDIRTILKSGITKFILGAGSLIFLGYEIIKFMSEKV
jgi:SMC interacting uncharacterized protein involved in chromosome segregation